MRRRALGSLSFIFISRTDQQDNLTSGKAVGYFYRREPTSDKLFVQFGQLTSNDALTITKHLQRVFDSVLDSMRSFIEDQRRFNIRKFLEPGATRRASRRQKTKKRKLIRRQTGRRNRRNQG